MPLIVLKSIVVICYFAEISNETWETIVLVFGIMLFMVCGGAVISRWVCDFMNKFKSPPESDPRLNRRQRIACTGQSQVWSPIDLPPPYGPAPSYDDVLLGDLLALELPTEPPPYCIEPPPEFEPADADEFDYPLNQELHNYNDNIDEALPATNDVEPLAVGTISLSIPAGPGTGKQEIFHSGLGVNVVDTANSVVDISSSNTSHMPSLGKGTETTSST